MLKNTFIKLNKVMFWVFCCILVASIILIIVFSVCYPQEIIGIIMSAVGIVIGIPAGIVSFLAQNTLPKEYNCYSICSNFTDRSEIIQQIINDINNGKSVIKIKGTPISGVSELLVRFTRFKKDKILLNTYCKQKICAKKFRKNIGKCFYIDGREYKDRINTLKDELISIINLKSIHRKLILLDHIHVVENPNKILEFIALNGGTKVVVICDIGLLSDNDAYEISAFNNEKIKELALTYGISLTDVEAKTLYDLSWGNVGLLNVFLRNYNTNLFSEIYAKKIDDTTNELICEIINKILDITKTRQLAILCATLNYSEVEFNLNKLCAITGKNISISDINNLTKTGLFIQKGNSYFSNNYFSYLIRNSQNYEIVSQYVPKILDFYIKAKDEKAKSIILLCKGSLSKTEISFIKTTLLHYSFSKSGENIDYITKIYSAYSENRMIDFKKDSALRDLEQEIVYQYLSSLIFIGDYISADNTLKAVNNLDKSSDRMNFLDADLQHLLNNYEDAESGFTILSQRAKSLNMRQQSLLKLSHCYKHMGRFNDALEILNSIIKSDAIDKVKIKAKIYSLSIYILNNDYPSLYSMISDIEQSENNLNDDQKATLDRYRAIAYANKNDYKIAIQYINNAINIYRKTESRLILNCYYIRGEINRHFHYYDAAYNDFIICYNSTISNGDYNLKSMVITSIELICNKIKGKKKIQDTEIAKALQICSTKHMQYNADILSKLLQDSCSNENFSKELIEPIYIIP